MAISFYFLIILIILGLPYLLTYLVYYRAGKSIFIVPIALAIFVAAITLALILTNRGNTFADKVKLFLYSDSQVLTIAGLFIIVFSILFSLAFWVVIYVRKRKQRLKNNNTRTE